jgi:hypothetical protein
MKFLIPFALCFAIAIAHEMEEEESRLSDIYESGEVHMSIMKAKESSWDQRRTAGKYNSSQYPVLSTYTRCVDGRAGEFRCKNVDLAYFANHQALGSSRGEGSSSWGWTSPEGREIIIIGQVTTPTVSMWRMTR